jgi:membrane protease YdiL (CAAX protease family)
MAPLLLEFAIIIALVVAELRGLVPYGSTPFLLAIGWISLRLRNLGWHDLGFVRPPHWPRAIALGTAAGLAIEVLGFQVTGPLFAELIGRHPDLSDFQPVVGNLRGLLQAMAFMWILAAMGEELVFRGYLMNRVADLWGRTASAWVVSLVLVSILFGLGHERQGPTGMLVEGFSGLLFGLLYLGSGRTLTIPIVAHGMANTLDFLLMFSGRYPGV